MSREKIHHHTALQPPGHPLTARTWRDLIHRHPLGMCSALLLGGLLAMACLAPLIAPYDPYQFQLNARGFPMRLQPPGATFLLGTDTHGRDVLSRIIYGSRVSILVGFGAVASGAVLGTLIGLVAGSWEGQVDQGLQRLVETISAVPGIVLALVVLSVYGQSTLKVMLAIGLVIAPEAARVVRSAVLASKQQLFMEAALAAGASSWRLLRRHLLPQVCPSLLVLASAWLSQAIVTEAALSFLGFGTPLSMPTWGGMLSGAERRSLVTAPYLVLFPGLALSMVVLALHTFGEAVRDLLAPHLHT